MSSREQLHELVDRLPDSEIPTALRVLAALSVDPLTRALAAAPLDDEPYTEEQQRRDLEADARIERGEGIPMEEVKRQLGLCDDR